MTPSQGELLGGRYRLGEALAHGGMGQVWRATDELLGRQVAVKVLHDGGPDQTVAGEEFRARFRDEARLSAALAHPNIATVYDFGDDEDHPYLVMELVEGESLAAVLTSRGPLPADEVASLVGQAALALQVAHEGGVVHRDIKPANIMVTPGGMVKLTDFGIARAAAGSGLTRTGEVLGTPHYLSPEQAQGQPATAASDLYALGVVAHELLTGNRPFDGESMVATALAHVSQPVPQLPESVPAPLRTAVMAALAKDPGERPESAGEFAAMLGMPVGPVTPPVSTSVGGAAPGHTAVLDLPSARAAATASALTGTAERARSRRLRRWWLLPLGGALAVLAVVVATLALSGPRNTPATTGPTTTPVPTTTKTSPTSRATSKTSTATQASPAARSPQPAPAPRPHDGHRKGKGGKKK